MGTGGWFKGPGIFRDRPDDAGPTIQSSADRIKALQKLAAKAPGLPAAEQVVICTELRQGLIAEADPLVRAQMLQTAAAISHEAAAGLLRDGLQDSDRDVRVACCQAWGRRQGQDAARHLAETLSGDTDIDVRMAAARALGQVRDPQSTATVVAALGLALEDPDPAMQHRAVRSLEQATGKNFGNDVGAWREFARGGNPSPPTLAQRLRSWF